MDVKHFPEMGLQFNPAQEYGVGTSNGELLEIIAGDLGKGVVVGHEFDVESDNGGHPLASHGHIKGGMFPCLAAQLFAENESIIRARDNCVPRLYVSNDNRSNTNTTTSFG
jgi:hypothetical protein